MKLIFNPNSQALLHNHRLAERPPGVPPLLETFRVPDNLANG